MCKKQDCRLICSIVFNSMGRDPCIYKEQWSYATGGRNLLETMQNKEIHTCSSLQNSKQHGTTAVARWAR